MPRPRKEENTAPAACESCPFPDCKFSNLGNCPHLHPEKAGKKGRMPGLRRQMPELHRQGRALLLDGERVTEVARKLGVSLSTVYRWQRALVEEGEFARG